MAAAQRRRGLRLGFTTVRDVLSYTAGMIVLGHEVFMVDQPSIPLLTLGMALVGLPTALGAGGRGDRGPRH